MVQYDKYMSYKEDFSMKNKRVVSLLMAVILMLTLLPATPASAKAKTKLSAKSITMTVGDTKTIKLLNSKKGAVWSRENSNINIISETKKKVKIKAVEEGKSIVYALVGKKEYKCKITIKEKEKPKNTNTPKPTNKPTPEPETIPDITTTSEPEDKKYISNFTIPEQEIYNGNEVSISISNTETTDRGINIEFTYVNNSDKDYSMSAHEYAVNGLMAGEHLYGSDVDVPARKKAKSSILIEYEWFKDAEITDFKKLEVMFWAYYNSFKEWESGKISISTNKDDGKTYIPSGNKIYSDENMELNYISNDKNTYKFCLKNRTQFEKSWTLSNCSINDWAYDLGSCKYDLYSEPVLDGCYTIFELVIDDDFLNYNNIKEINNIEFDLEFEYGIKSDKIRLDINNGTVSASIISKPSITPTLTPIQTPEPVITSKPEPTIAPQPTATSKPIIPMPVPTVEPKPTVAPVEYNVEILAEYTLSQNFSKYKKHFIVIKNNSSETVDIVSSSLAYMLDGTMVGAANSKLYALGAGCISVLYEMFETDNEIGYYETQINPSPSKIYKSVIQDLSYIQNDIEKGAVFQVTNNGDDAAEFVKGYVLFFQGDKLVDYKDRYFTNNENEISPGETISKQITTYEDFNRVEFYLTGRK